MTKQQLLAILDVVNDSKPFMKLDSQYIRWRKAKEWLEDEIKSEEIHRLENEERRIH